MVNCLPRPRYTSANCSLPVPSSHSSTYALMGDPLSPGGVQRITSVLRVRFCNFGAIGASGGQASVRNSTTGASFTLISSAKALKRTQ